MAGPAKQSAAVDLLAVIFVARLPPGPRLVFHYPPNPQRPIIHRSKDQDDSDSNSDSEHDITHAKLRLAEPTKNGGYTKHDQTLAPPGAAKGKELSSHDILGYSEDTLQKLLSPGCWSDRKKFEMYLDGMTFLGHPIWAAQDGSWVRRHSHDDEQSKQQSTPPLKPRSRSHGQDSAARMDSESSKAGVPKSVRDFTHVPESFDSRGAGQSFATSMASESSANGVNTAEKLTMFNIVFVLAPSNHDRDVAEVYQHVAKTLSKALHYCQRQSQYLGLQSKKIFNAKAKARQDGLSEEKTNERLIESSELAWCLKEVFEKIRRGEVAGIRFNRMEMALQIPCPSTSGLDTDQQIEPHNGLLLTESKDTMLRELTNQDASTLAYFIREHTPTKSLQKLATRLVIPLEETLHIARHLIKWRKARAIDPLHPRNTYIISPSAPLSQLQTHSEDYAQKFPVLPSLTQMLRFLTGKPVRYGMLIPSRDHRTPYLQILAYLVQHHIVQQLKTYGWLQAPTTPARRVRRMEEELNENRRPLSVASLLSPQMRPVRDDDNISVSSERTAIPVSLLDSIHRRVDFTSFPRHDNVMHGNGDNEPLEMVKDPLSPSSGDELRLQHIKDSVEDDELRDRFPSLLRYFDGMFPFEEIAASEGVKRAKVEAWLDALQKSGFLVSFRAA